LVFLSGEPTGEFAGLEDAAFGAGKVRRAITAGIAH
jgi:hypothetical protein